MIPLLLGALIVGGVLGILWAGFDQLRAKPVDCPVCGKSFKLVNDSYKCPKCRTRVVKTKDGDIITTN